MAKTSFIREMGEELNNNQNTGRWNYSALTSRQVSIYWFGFFVLILLPSLWYFIFWIINIGKKGYDRAERHSFWPTFVILFPFSLPSQQKSDQKSCLSARSKVTVKNHSFLTIVLPGKVNGPLKYIITYIFF